MSRESTKTRGLLKHPPTNLGPLVGWCGWFSYISEGLGGLGMLAANELAIAGKVGLGGMMMGMVGFSN